MSDNRSLGARLREEATNDLSVSVVSAIFAVVALFAFGWVGDSTTGGLLLALDIAVFVPYAYERYWPVEYPRGEAIVWTLSAALVTAGLFVGVYGLALGTVGEVYAAGVAFAVTVALQYATAALFGHVRRNA